MQCTLIMQKSRERRVETAGNDVGLLISVCRAYYECDLVGCQ